MEIDGGRPSPEELRSFVSDFVATGEAAPSPPESHRRNDLVLAMHQLIADALEAPDDIVYHERLSVHINKFYDLLRAWWQLPRGDDAAEPAHVVDITRKFAGDTVADTVEHAIILMSRSHRLAHVCRSHSVPVDAASRDQELARTWHFGRAVHYWSIVAAATLPLLPRLAHPIAVSVYAGALAGARIAYGAAREAHDSRAESVVDDTPDA